MLVRKNRSERLKVLMIELSADRLFVDLFVDLLIDLSDRRLDHGAIDQLVRRESLLLTC